MTLPEHGELRAGWVEDATRVPGVLDRIAGVPTAAAGYSRKALALVSMEAQKLRHDPTELLTRAVQPALWLIVFGSVFTQIRAIPTGSQSYIAFLTPGILAQSVLFVAIFYGIAAIWERDLGILHKFMATPTPRTALVLGKALSAGLRGLSQVVIIYALALVLGVTLNWNPLALLGVLAIVLLGAALFSTLSLIIASFVKTRERFMGIGQLLTMPLFFASNAIYPVSIMPSWLQAIAAVNPMTYMVDALRTLISVPGAGTNPLALDFAVLGGFALALILIAGRSYEKLVR